MSIKNKINDFGDSLKDFIVSKDHLKEGLTMGVGSTSFGLSAGSVALGVAAMSQGHSGIAALAAGIGLGILASGIKLSVEILNLDEGSKNWNKTFEKLNHDKIKQMDTNGSLTSHIGTQATNIVHNIAVKLGLPASFSAAIAGGGAGFVAGASAAFCASSGSISFQNMAMIGAASLASIGLGMVANASLDKSEEKTRDIKFHRDNSNELSL